MTATIEAVAVEGGTGDLRVRLVGDIEVIVSDDVAVPELRPAAEEPA